MADTIPIPRELVDRALILIGAWRIDTHSTKPEVWPGSPINLESQAVLEGIAAALRSALTQQAEPTDDEQQSAFEKWLSRVCPSGDVESVHAQWLASSDYLDLFEAATPPSPSAETAHRQGCDALGGYGNGIGPCTCGAQPSGEVLTKEEIRAVEHSVDWNTSREVVEFARAIERATLAKIGGKR